MDDLELLEFCLNYLKVNPDLGDTGEIEFCRYCFVEDRQPHESNCKYNRALLKLIELINKLKMKDSLNE